MKYLISLLVMCVFVFSAFAGCDDIQVIPIHSNHGVNTGTTIDSADADTSYFRMPNTQLDSLIFYYQQTATGIKPFVTCSLHTTVDNISAGFSQTGEADNTLAKDARWTIIDTLFADNTIIDTLKTYGLTDSLANSNYGLWGRLLLTTTGHHHNPATTIERMGVIIVPRSR